MDEPHPLKRAIAQVGLTALAKACAVSHQAVRKWEAAGRLPRTEWTGETSYSAAIEAMCEGRVTRAELLQPWPKAESVGAQRAAA